MSVPLVLDNVKVKVRIPLMCSSQLMVTNDLGAGNLLPLRGPYVMLGVNERVANKANVRQDTHEVRGRHRVPLVTVDFGVVDLKTSSLETQLLGIGPVWEKATLTIRVGANIAPRRIQSLQS